MFNSKNMNYIYYVEYFSGLTNDPKQDEEIFIKRNSDIIQTKFQVHNPFSSITATTGTTTTVSDYSYFELYTMYPGLLIGTGNAHDYNEKGCLKQGFSFDYVTGLPYIPGSSLKGMLRSCFPENDKEQKNKEEHKKYIKALLNINVDVDKLRDDIFGSSKTGMGGGKDIFLGAYPAAENNGKTLLETDYITAINPDKYSAPDSYKKFKEPNPIQIIKVKPNVKFCFSFILQDSDIGGIKVSAADKLKLFESLILDMGIGAKTNTGFGKFSKTAIKNVPQQVRNEAPHTGTSTNNREKLGTCPLCGKNVVVKGENFFACENRNCSMIFGRYFGVSVTKEQMKNLLNKQWVELKGCFFRNQENQTLTVQWTGKTRTIENGKNSGKETLDLKIRN